MIVSCTACKTRYLVDPAVLGEAGRVVRCAKCKHSWMQTPPADLPRRLDLVPVQPSLPPALPPAPNFGLPVRYHAPRRRRWPVAVAAAAVAGLLVGTGVGYFGRDRIIETWPSTKRVYELIGEIVGVPTSNLEVQDVRLVEQPLAGLTVLVLEGKVVNTSDQPQAMPELRASLLDAKKRDLFAWTFAVDQEIVAPGEIVKFRTEAINPPEAYERPLITFVGSTEP
jgi:predicted Zn finger-like uncharacterized protein